jgi:DNA-directed RNA polymerase sigma subunit (sigma70/sigma32)
MSVKNVIAGKPKQVVKRLLTALPERARDVLTGRFGLGYWILNHER